MARILVVDDNQANLDLMLYLLRSFGHDAHGAQTAEAALELAAGSAFDLALSDVLMPDVDGYEFARRFKSDARRNKVPILAVTALAMAGDRESVLAAGFDGYLAKPIDPQNFVAQIEAYLPEGLRSNRG